jgi:tetrahydromethanopterin S-methyltransferase subunit C
MVTLVKKFGMMFLWMGIAASVVLLIYSYFNIPDELAGVLYFIAIGLAASGVLNYYR